MLRLPARLLHRYVKDADKEIIAHLKASGRLIDNSSYTHSYPFCWRSDTPLIYKVGGWLFPACLAGRSVMANVPLSASYLDVPRYPHASWHGCMQAVPSWFVKVTDFRERLLAANAGTYWVPRHVKDGRFHNWLESARDWSAPVLLFSCAAVRLLR
jgi:isoleucyl-tRNA synthetase